MSWGKLHGEELCDLYASQNIRMVISRTMRWVGNGAWMGDTRNSYKILLGKPEGKRQFRRSRGR
jgi:hypothetical protein